MPSREMIYLGISSDSFEAVGIDTASQVTPERVSNPILKGEPLSITHLAPLRCYQWKELTFDLNEKQDSHSNELHPKQLIFGRDREPVPIPEASLRACRYLESVWS